MPTLIGRFNELLHNLSSNNNSSTTTTSSNLQQQSSSNAAPHRSSSSSRHPPGRSHSNRVPTTSNNNDNLSNRCGRQIVVKKQQQQHSKPPASAVQQPSASSSSSSSSRRYQHHHYHNHHGTTNQKDFVEVQRRNSRPHRASSCTVSQCRHLSHNNNSSSSSCSTKRESNTSSVNQHQQQQQQHQSRRHQRRHSIASVSSVSNTSSQHNNNSNPVVGGGKNSHRNNNRNNMMMMMALAKNSAKIEKNNNLSTNDNNKEKVDDSMQSNLMKPVTPANSSTSNDNDDHNNGIDESLASMLVRKIKIGAITRRSPSYHPMFHRKITKIFKKDVESDAVDGDSKGCFINRYLDGHLTRSKPDIISGKTCYDMPIKDVEIFNSNIVAACTGPDNGLLTIKNSSSKPFELADDVDFIDEDYPDSSLSSNGCDSSPQNSAKLSTSSVSSDTGVDTTTAEKTLNNKNNKENESPSFAEPVAGVDNWNRSSDFAYGISTTLYESHPSTKQKAGDPIADSYAICVRENSAIIALADGVNWGDKACLASRSAVHGCIDYLNKALYTTPESTRSRNTMEIFIALLRSFNEAHNMILSQGGHLTTLCAAVICQLKGSDRFIVCTCNVGDSLAYVYSPFHGVREITEGSHDIFSMRDMRDALGALGPVSGSEPELNNLTVAMTIVDVGDIVFLTSDGISDNFDPVVGKFAIPKKEHHQHLAADNNEMQKTDNKMEKTCENTNPKPAKQQKSRKIVQRSNSNPEKSSTRRLNYTSKGLPLVSAQQRHELTLLRMDDLIMNGVNGISLDDSGNQSSNKISAKELCSLMVDFSTKLTMAKRRILEDPELYSDNDEDLQGNEAFDRQRSRRRMVGPKLAQVPGKLDHASIAAVEVGFFGSLKSKKSNNNGLFNQKMKQTTTTTNNNNSKHSSENRYNLRMKATLARFESQDSLESINEAGPI